MSIALMTLVWRVPFPTSTQMVIALKLADHAEDDGSKIYPGRASLAERARCSESTVKATLKIFRETGILVVVEEGGKGPHHTTKYRMNVNLLEAIAKGDVAISGGSDGIVLAWGEHREEKGAEFDPLENYPVSQLAVRGQNSPAKGSASNPQPIKNHQEPSARESASATQSALGPSAYRAAFTLTERDVQWTEWLSEIEARGSAEMRAAAVKAGSITVESKWPKPTTPLPRISGYSMKGKMAAAGSDA